MTVIIIMSTILSGCGFSGAYTEASSAAAAEETHGTGMLELEYAEAFSIEHYGDGCDLVDIPGSESFVVADEGEEIPKELSDKTVIRRPVDGIYLASSSAMDYFRQLGCLNKVGFTGTKPSDWSIDEVRDMVEGGDILYAGKYNSPDYELLLDGGCRLAIENTMIYHNPEAMELLIKLGIPVIVERSSYEKHPLGRMEWIKLYGCLLGKEEEAESFFEEQVRELKEITEEKYGKTAAFFYITAGGYVNVRKPGDYIAKMIELAGGEYILADLEPANDNASSSMNISMEEFYMRAKDADILIYNSNIDGELASLSELIAKEELFGDFRAVAGGNVWCSEKDMFQEATRAGEMIGELRGIFSGNADEELKYFHRLD